MPPTITRGNIIGIMIRLEAGHSSGDERNLPFQHRGELWKRRKAIFTFPVTGDGSLSKDLPVSLKIYCMWAGLSHHHIPPQNNLQDGWSRMVLSLREQSIFSVIISTLKIYSLLQNDFLVPVTRLLTHLQEMIVIHSLQEDSWARSNSWTEFENKNSKWLYSSWWDDGWGQAKLIEL